MGSVEGSEKMLDKITKIPEILMTGACQRALILVRGEPADNKEYRF